MGYLSKYFRGTIATQVLREVGNVETINSQSIRVLERDSNNDVSECSGTVSYPTDGGTGYAVGCEYVDTDASAGAQLYINEGSNTSCDFNLVKSTTSLFAADNLVATDKKIQFRDAGIYINSSVDGQMDIVADGEVQLAAPKFDLNGVLDVEDNTAGGASNGNIIKKTLQAGEAYTGTTAGLMVKHYGEATATVPSGEFTGLYVSVKGLHVSPGDNASLVSAHVHGDNTTTIHAGLWMYGDLENGVKVSSGTLADMIDMSQATEVTNAFKFPAAATDKVIEANTGTPGACNYIVRSELADGTPIYTPAYTSKPS